MNASHTPGPWVYVGGIRQVGETYHECGQIYPVSGNVTSENPDEWNYRGEICCVQSANHISNGITAEETKANARLIAAAPELLEALQSIMSLTGEESINEQNVAMEKASAAIAKATGGAQ